MFIVVPFTKVEAKTLGDLKNELKALEKKQAEAEDKKNLTESQIKTLTSEINTITANIAKTKEDIKTTEKDIISSEQEIENKREETDELLKFLQISSGENVYLEYIFEADSYTDFIYRYSVVTQMSDYNQEIISELNELIDTLNSKKIQLSEKQRELSKKKNQLQTQYALIQTQYEEEHADGLDLADQIEEQKASIKRFERLGCKRNDNINNCNGMAAVSGWVYPLDKFYQSSSYAEVRGSVRHYAVDLAIGEGTPVRAAGEGQVLSAGLTSTVKSCYSDYMDKYYTNCHCGGYVIKILHNYKGTTYISLYMHMLTSNVKAGDKVAGGDIIGTSGGGRIEADKWHDHCTAGAHLHYAMAYGTYIGYSSQKGSTFDPVIFYPAMKGEGSWYGYS